METETKQNELIHESLNGADVIEPTKKPRGRPRKYKDGQTFKDLPEEVKLKQIERMRKWREHNKDKIAGYNLKYKLSENGHNKLKEAWRNYGKRLREKAKSAQI
jgi:hypothetical protein